MRLAVIFLLSASVVRAEIARPPLPSAEDFHNNMADQAVQAIGGSQRAGEALGEGACPAIDLSGEIRIDGRLLSLKKVFDIKKEGRAIGSIQSDGKGYDLRDGQGKMAAFLRSQPQEDGSLITLSDCAGATLGDIVETKSDSNGSRSFAVRSPQGDILGISGPVGFLQSSIVLRDAAGRPVAELKKAHWFLDLWSLHVHSANFDSRLGAALLMANSEADARETSRRKS